MTKTVTSSFLILIISHVFPNALYADTSNIHSVQNQISADLQLTNLSISGYQHLVDFLVPTYPSKLSTKQSGIGEQITFTKT